MTNKEKSLLRAAARPCGLSYRSACNRDRLLAIKLMRDGFMWLKENKNPRRIRGVEVRKYIYFITAKGLSELEKAGVE